MIDLYKVNPENFSLLFGCEKIARAVASSGETSMKDVVLKTEEPIRIDRKLLLYWSIYKRDAEMLEALLNEKLPDRFSSLLLFEQFMLWKIQTMLTLSENSEDKKIFWQSFLDKEEEKLI